MLNRNVKNGDGQQIEKGAKANTLAFALHSAHLFVILRLKSRSFSISAEKRKVSFVLHSIFRNFGRNLKLSLFIGGLGDNAVFEVTIWKPSDFRILPRYAYC